MKDSFLYEFGKTVYDLSTRSHVMGILNITPDSFSDGGMFNDFDAAVKHAIRMQDEGADFIDIGGQSTRPGAEEISLDEELNRVIPILKEVVKQIKIPVSVDTYRSAVADEALSNGAVIVNDISGFDFDTEMPKVIAGHNATAVVMHMKGTPQTMQANPHYDDLIEEIMLYFEDAAWKANVEGIKQVIMDPGIGFGKTVEHNLKIIKNISVFKKLDSPIMIGISRKSTIGKILNIEDVNERLEGTIALNTLALANGVNIIRVHDVKEGVRTAKIFDAYRKA
ncbi:MAG TPA: dihydropteroate synthase [Ignavibacteria bacterium]|jgi:dihydropteroate synthase